ncbi:MAG: glycine cleavage system aminomethyltransferase GcvT [Myxococcales bacterium]|nr:glycine cleavage system aminomethyltransferase GcvT [Myxococcales bacterium]
MSHAPTAGEPKRTPLYEKHVALGAKVIDFGGWAMPLQYSGILDEHKAVREAVGLFDVSHMGEIEFVGPRAEEAVQRVVTNDVSKIPDDGAQYTCTCREDGGIVDDFIVYRHDAQHFLIVVNASNIEKDFAHFRAHAGGIAELSNRSDGVALLAIQGPKAIALVTELTSGAVPAKGFTFCKGEVGGVSVWIARTGYTGEDGVELFAPSVMAPLVWDRILAAGAKYGIKPIGLGARDTLRLEARLCLYGNDIDDDHNPHEAGLSWVVKGRGFVGEEALARIKAEGPKRRLVGFKVQGRGIARHGYPILHGDRAVGIVTSGTVAPTVGGAIGMGYVPAELAAPGTRLVVDCRGKPAEIAIHQGPFYKRAA